ncbi:MAG: hypothetical protein IJ841_08405 [Prevotella sp.]|nr:hypothetical protein [Prevotella sp.]
MATFRAVDYEGLRDLLNYLNDKYNEDCILDFEGKNLFPYVDKGEKIVFSKRMNTILSLFTAYKYDPEKIHKRLFLYLMANLHIETGNWYNARIVLDALKEANRGLTFDYLSITDKVDFYLDFQAEAMLAHEYGHYIFGKNPIFLDNTKQAIYDFVVSTRHNGLKGRISGYIVDKVLNDKILMEELSCDWFAMEVMSGRLKECDLSKLKLEQIFQQIIRMFISTNYIEEILPSKGIHIIGEMKRKAFGFLRTTLVTVRLNDDWEEVTPTLMREEMSDYRIRQRAARRLLFNKLKYHRMRKNVSYTMSRDECMEIIKDFTDTENNLYNWIYYDMHFLDYSVLLEDRDPLINSFLNEFYENVLEPEQKDMFKL